jgi:hypothetical protein
MLILVHAADAKPHPTQAQYGITYGILFDTCLHCSHFRCCVCDV